MAALVQTATMLQTRPSSASGMLQNTPQNSAHHQYSSSASNMQRNSFHGLGSLGQATYRAPAQNPPYAFTSSSSAVNNGQGQPSAPLLRADQRTVSVPVVPTVQNQDGASPRARYPAAASVSTTSSSSSDNSQQNLKVDTSVSSSSSSPATVKQTPDRYRRTANRQGGNSPTLQGLNAAGVRSGSPGPGSVSGGTLPNYDHLAFKTLTDSKEGLNLQLTQFNTSPAPAYGQQSGAKTSMDDMQLHRQPATDPAKRYRRRSIATIDTEQLRNQPPALTIPPFIPGAAHKHPLRSSPVTEIRPGSAHGRQGSSESVVSHRSNNTRPGSSNKRDAPTSIETNPASSAAIAGDKVARPEQLRVVNIPPRASSNTDAASGKRTITPSPLSRPVTMGSDSQATKDSFASTVNAALKKEAPTKPSYAQVVNGNAVPASPAAKQLAALNDKDKKSKSSRLRRAFSFGSAAELRRASAENNAAANSVSAAERARLRKERAQEEEDAEQARIAAKQEQAGLGNSIYSGQGNFFSGSTDNLSISSTASSASVMIRKMGKGMKKSTRSLVGLFRPKSVTGVPAADGPVRESSTAQVSMVTVEAEREKLKVNVNSDPHAQVGGGTGFPKLERNSIDAANAALPINERLGSSSTDNSGSRRSIVGGEKERAEVLAAVKKGILKRSGAGSGSSSPTVRPADNKGPAFNLPMIPAVNDSPNSSAPSTPTDDPHGHRRQGSIAVGGEDYFMSALRFQGNSNSAPTTPQGTKRNATFSPRIIFHDTWTSGEYDRRGDIATCNKLTPMLAQQIKEELNTFKMEMEVHENSKIYTHFF